MVTVIKKQQIMTLRQLKEKYATKWFRYVIVDETETVAGEPESIMCYVVYVADTEDEIYRHPYTEENTKLVVGVDAGDRVEEPMEIGGIYVHA